MQAQKQNEVAQSFYSEDILFKKYWCVEVMQNPKISVKQSRAEFREVLQILWTACENPGTVGKIDKYIFWWTVLTC